MSKETAPAVGSGGAWPRRFLAGPRSASAALVQICLCHVNVAIDLPGLPQIPAPVTDQSCAATSSANTLIGVGCPHAPPSCANLHSARRSRRQRLPFPAGSLYGLCQGGVSIGDRSAHLFSFVSFFVRSESSFLRPDLHLACRWRAQKLSRLAVAPTLSDKLRHCQATP